MSQLDPRDLIDVPGAGRAEVALRAMGAWDEGRSPEAVEWEVTVYASVTVTQTFRIRAVTEEDAERLAIAKSQADADWLWDRNGHAPSIDSAIATELTT